MPKIKQKNGQKIETESITLRIDKSVLDELRNESVQKMESINTLANQVLKSYVVFQRPATKAGSFYIPKPLITDVFEMLTEEQIIKVTESWVKSQSKDFMMMVNKEHKLASFLEGYRDWLDLSDFNYTHNHADNGFEHYVVRFNMGKKFNFHMGKSLKFLFEELQVKDFKIEITDNAVMFRFKKE